MAAISDTKTAPVAEVISSCPVPICVGGAEFSVMGSAAKGGRHA